MGKLMTSRIDVAPVISITIRSIPKPKPPVGGIPNSIARKNSSSVRAKTKGSLSLARCFRRSVSSAFRWVAWSFGSFDEWLTTQMSASTAAGWVVVLRVIKLGVVGVIYGVSTVLFMALLGRLAFGESLRPQEVLGLCLGIASIMLLARFS